MQRCNKLILLKRKVARLLIDWRSISIIERIKRMLHLNDLQERTPLQIKLSRGETEEIHHTICIYCVWNNASPLHWLRRWMSQSTSRCTPIESEQDQSKQVFHHKRAINQILIGTGWNSGEKKIYLVRPASENRLETLSTFKPGQIIPGTC